MISGYILYVRDSNCNAGVLSTSGIYDIGIIISKRIPAVQMHLDTWN